MSAVALGSNHAGAARGKILVRHILLVTILMAAGAATSPALDREAFTFTRYDLRVTISPQTAALAASGTLTLRNDSPVSQRSLALQISSSLQWSSIEVGGKRATYAVGPYTTDVDHTGSMTEAVVSLPVEVAPQQAVELQVAYAGSITADSTRLTRIGVPEASAAHIDWDQIGKTFTAVRGPGYVTWYPVAITAASLSEGDSVSAALGNWRRRQEASSLHLVLVSDRDRTVITNGSLLRSSTTAAEKQESEYAFAAIGLYPPVLVMGNYALVSRPAIDVFYLAGHLDASNEWARAAEAELPLLSDWFGAPKEKVRIVELPDPQAAAFESGAMLFIPLGAQAFGPEQRKQAEYAVAHQIAHACFRSPRPWISEGLAHFAQLLVREQQDGRKSALSALSRFNSTVVQAEEQARESNPEGGQSLILATDETLYRYKAMFVWWMLRDISGDQALRRALHAYKADEDRDSAYFQRLLAHETGRDLEWFFDDWVYRDRGLPSFEVTSAFPRPLLERSYLVTVTVENTGNAGAVVPVTVHSIGADGSQRIEIRAHEKATARIQVFAAPTEIAINDGSIPHTETKGSDFKLPPVVLDSP